MFYLGMRPGSVCAFILHAPSPPPELPKYVTFKRFDLGRWGKGRSSLAVLTELSSKELVSSR